jgi:hypothetical protein
MNWDKFYFLENKIYASGLLEYTVAKIVCDAMEISC